MDRSKVKDKLVKDGVLFILGDRYFFADRFKETGLSKFDTIRQMTSTEHAVIVIGGGKYGNHSRWPVGQFNADNGGSSSTSDRTITSTTD